MTDTSLAPSARPSTADPAFFPVSRTKLAILCICTGGLYELYWFCKNWRLVRARERTNLSAVWRSLFAYFFCYSLFNRIRNFREDPGGTSNLPAGLLATGWIVTMLSSALPEPYWMVSLFAFVFLLPVQADVNRINSSVAPEHDRNANFTAANWTTAVVGGALMALAAYGTLARP
jgi:hypothetical protein